MKGVQNGTVAAGLTRKGGGVDFADEAVSALWALGDEVAVGQMVIVEALVIAIVGGVEGRKRAMCTAAHSNFAGAESGRSVDGVVISGLDVRQERMPLLLLLVEAHGQDQGHDVVDTLYVAIGAGVVQASVDIVDDTVLVEGVGELGITLQAVVRTWRGTPTKIGSSRREYRR